MSKGFNIFYHILTFFTIRKTEQKEPDMNHIPKSVTWKLYLSSPKILPPYTLSSIFQQHFSTNRRNSKQTRKLLYYHAKLGYYHGNRRLLRDIIISLQSPQKTELFPQQKKGSKCEKTKPKNPQNILFSVFSAIPHCINFIAAMFIVTVELIQFNDAPSHERLEIGISS